MEQAIEKSDFDKTFLPFEVKPHMTLAPRPFDRDEAARTHSKRKLDEILSNPDPDSEMKDDSQNTRDVILDLLNYPPYKRQRRYAGEPPKQSTKQLIIRLSTEDATIPVNAPSSAYAIRNDVLKELNTLPRKVILQHSGLRPAYIGTFTKTPTTPGLLKGRNPFQRSIPNLNYEYDSEEEWAVGDNEEGEDILSGDEEDEDSGSDEEMNEFLDDEEDTLAKVPRKKILVELEPVCTGLCWEVDGQNPNHDLSNMRMEPLLDISGPIDPFKDYWSKKPAVPPASKQTAINNPLFLTPSSASSSKSKTAAKPKSPTTGMPPPKAPAKPKALVPADQMDQFKAEIVANSGDAKADLVKKLKEKFPSLSKECINNTVGVVAARVPYGGVKMWRLLADDGV